MPDVKDQPIMKAADAVELQNAIVAASVRSRKVRNVTFTLLVVLILTGIFLMYSAQKHAAEDNLRAKEIKTTQEQLRTSAEEQKKLVQQAENSRKAAEYLASGAYKAGRLQWKGAITDYDKALALDPNNPSALSLKGYLLLRMGNAIEAESLLRRSVQGDPNNLWNHYNFALALWAVGKKSEAMEQLREVVQQDSSFKTTISRDPQFHAFRSDPAFQELLKD